MENFVVHLKTIAALIIFVGSIVGLFWFRGIKAGVPWICKLIGRPDLIKSDYYGPMFEMDENHKFHLREDEDDEDDDEDEEELSKY